MVKLGVNIDHIATLRQARYKTTNGIVPEPDPAAAAAEVELAGAHGITVHLREDRRHIQDRDVRLLRQTIRTRLNLEMADVPEIVAIAEEIKPDEVCLVPEKRMEVTTEGGLNVRGAGKSLKTTIARLKQAGIVVSLFVDPDHDQIQAAMDVGGDVVELHTGTYANAKQPEAELKKLVAAAELAKKCGLRVNAGHGLNYINTRTVVRAVPHLETLNTGHAIICRAVFVGLRQAVREMLEVIASRMIIIGTGVDIVDTTRIQESLDKFGERFLKRCFLPGEIEYCQRMKLPALHIAARFAAKEAISKAFGTGIGHQLGWKDMEICKHDSGEPYVTWHGKGTELAKTRGVTGVFVSLSHCREYAVAQAVLVGD